jgi:peptidase M28-like protein/PDZ domain-containing protein/PA domain-containing protein
MFLAWCGILAILAGTSLMSAGAPDTTAKSATEDVTTYRSDVSRLASDEFEGRKPGTAGIERARQFLKERLKSAGMAPAFKDGTYFQAFDVPVSVRTKKQSLSAVGPFDRKLGPFQAGQDFSVFGFAASRAFSGQAVFVGYGLMSKARRYNSYSGLAAKALKGKVAIVYRFEPQDANGKSRWAKTGRWSREAGLILKARAAAAYGAAAVLVVNPPSQNANAELHTAAGTAMRMMSVIPAMHISLDVFEQMLTACGRDAKTTTVALQAAADRGKTRPYLLKGVTIKGDALLEPIKATIHNVAGVLPGEGELANEIIVVGGHYDHLGAAPPGAKGGKFFYGADDNASGTAAVLTLARWLGAAKPPGPRRTIVFALFSGEELGLLGSAYMTQHLDDLGIDVKQVAAMVNLDMIGRPQKDRLHIYGVDSGRGLRPIVQAVAKNSRLNIRVSGSGIGPSDQASFYRAGVPVLAFFTGLHKDYHRTTDTAEKIQFADAVRIIRVAHKIVQRLACAPQRLVYIGPGAVRRGMAYMGVLTGKMQNGQGCMLASVTPGSPADHAGLKAADVITQWDGKPVPDAEALIAAIRASKPGQKVALTVQRADEVIECEIVLILHPRAAKR